jgi:hypothetical protein
VQKDAVRSLCHCVDNGKRKLQAKPTLKARARNRQPPSAAAAASEDDEESGEDEEDDLRDEPYKPPKAKRAAAAPEAPGETLRRSVKNAVQAANAQQTSRCAEMSIPHRSQSCCCYAPWSSEGH